jgi:nitronate monooxygenase
MFMVTGPALVTEACKAGVIGGLPQQNARTFEEFTDWLKQIRDDLNRHADANPAARIAPLAVNISRRYGDDDFGKNLDVCVARWSAALGVAAERARYIGEQRVCQS